MIHRALRFLARLAAGLIVVAVLTVPVVLMARVAGNFCGCCPSASTCCGHGSRYPPSARRGCVSGPAIPGHRLRPRLARYPSWSTEVHKDGSPGSCATR
ncbi:MAG: hypothetical protein FD127_1762 [Acidimicrobiaceae bacterium]|nr:MAG: hypothetical protein FD127_1762 [Acidimicrobiaceae bacterium]